MACLHTILAIQSMDAYVESVVADILCAWILVCSVIKQHIKLPVTPGVRRNASAAESDGIERSC